MKKLIITFITVLSIISAMAQQSVNITKIWLEHGVTQNSQQGIQVHLSVQAIGFAKVNMIAVAYLDHPKGVGLRDTNGKYCTTDGTVAFTTNFTPPYDNSTWDDMKIFIPYGEMHLLEGNHTYYCRVFIFKVDGGIVTNSQFVEFQGTVSKNENHNSNLTPAPDTMPDDRNRKFCYKNKDGRIASITSYINNGEWNASVYFQESNGTDHLYGFTRQYVDDTKWVYKGGYPLAYTMEERNSSTLHIALNWSYIEINGYRFDIPISKQEYDNLMPKSKVYINNGGNNNSGSNNSNDSGRSYVDGPCQYCGGGGGCSSCNGRGYKYNPYSGYNDTCPSCNGSGRCFNCRGTGKQATY